MKITQGDEMQSDWVAPSDKVIVEYLSEEDIRGET